MKTKREYTIGSQIPRRLWIVRDEEGAVMFTTTGARIAATWERNGLEVTL